MRCPKCGYISFDYLEECLKCRKNIKATSESLNGAVYNVASPAFLLFGKEAEEAGRGAKDVDMETEEFLLDDEFVDEDLEILVGGESQQDEPEIEISEDDDDQFEISLDDPDEDEDDSGEIEIDLSQFEDPSDTEPGVVESEDATIELGDDSIEITIPEELGDISDLAPPPVPEEPIITAIEPEPELEVKPVAESDFTSPDLELGDLDFDLGLDDLESGKAASVPEDPAVTLDDIDFSDALSLGDSEGEKKKGSIMEDELDFELDLGGLDIHKDV